MKSQALQKMIQKIFSDENTRQHFISDPESLISQYSLTEQEKKAVLSTHSKLGLVTSDSTQLEATLDPRFNWLAPTP